ncbi:MAG: acyl-ACP thioesterase domain-containing protein [Candidatus Limnocylindrales bacterium]
MIDPKSETAPLRAESLPADAGLEVLADRLPYRIVRKYRIRFEEATARETMRTAIYLAWVADIAWQHSTLLGFSREWYSARGLFWLVRAIQLDILEPACSYDDVYVSTQVTGYRRIAARRHSEVRDAAGELLAHLEIDWVMTNDKGVPTRVPTEMMAFIEETASTFEMLKVALPVTPPEAVERRFHVRRRDLDPLDHVNNSVYVDYLEEALDAAGQSDMLAATPRRYEIDFVAPAERNDALVGAAWPLDGGWAYRLRREDGTEVLRAKVARG